MTRASIASLAILVAVMTFAASCGGTEKAATTSVGDGVAEVVRQILGTTSPDTAPGQDLVLSRVIIPAGKPIATHVHPGPQLAIIVEGTLTYTVHSGEVRITRAAGTAGATNEIAGAGQTVELRPGDLVLETPTEVHDAKNATNGPVVIYLASLFPTGAPASSPAS